MQRAGVNESVRRFIRMDLEWVKMTVPREHILTGIAEDNGDIQLAHATFFIHKCRASLARRNARIGTSMTMCPIRLICVIPGARKYVLRKSRVAACGERSSRRWQSRAALCP